MRLKELTGVIKGGVRLSRNFHVRKYKIWKVALERKSYTSLNQSRVIPPNLLFDVNYIWR